MRLRGRRMVFVVTRCTKDVRCAATVVMAQAGWQTWLHGQTKERSSAGRHAGQGEMGVVGGLSALVLAERRPGAGPRQSCG